MTKSVTLAAKNRAATDNVKQLREAGSVPAVIYGRGIENRSVAVKKLDLERAYAEAGETSLVDLKLDGGDTVKVIIKAAQRDPVNDSFSHIDLYQVKMDEAIEVAVPLEFINSAPAVSDLGGTLVKNRDTLELKCLPGALPDQIIVDLSVLKTFEDAIRVRDLVLPKDIELLVEPDEPVAHVLEPQAEEPEAAAPTAAEAAPAAEAPKAEAKDK